MKQIIADICAGAKEFFHACAQRAPECFIYPNEIDFDHFRGQVKDTDGWKMLFQGGCRPEHLDALWDVILKEHRTMKNTIFLTIIQEFQFQEQNEIAIALDIVQWFRAKNFGCPTFACERATLPRPQSPQQLLEPLSVEETLKLLNQQKVLVDLVKEVSEPKKKVLREILSGIEEKLKRAG